MQYMDKWVDAVIHPLGIAGFSLFLVFLLLTKFSKGDSGFYKFVFVIMAVGSLAGGFFLSYQKMQSGAQDSKMVAKKILHGTNDKNKPATPARAFRPAKTAATATKKPAGDKANKSTGLTVNSTIGNISNQNGKIENVGNVKVGDVKQ